MDIKECRGAIEAMLFANAEPVTAQRLAEVLETEEQTVERLLLSLRDEYEDGDHGICLLQLEDCWQLATKNEFSAPVKKILDTRRNTPLSQAALETLSIIAYNQPVSRGFVEQVRGVDSSSTVAKLMEKGLIEEAGRLDLPGRPISFRTTDVFLRTFGLNSLAQLPSLHNDDLPLEAYAQEVEAAQMEQQSDNNDAAEAPAESEEAAL